jgi:hypothetical protein
VFQTKRKYSAAATPIERWTHGTSAKRLRNIIIADRGTHPAAARKIPRVAAASYNFKTILAAFAKRRKAKPAMRLWRTRRIVAGHRAHLEAALIPP